MRFSATLAVIAAFGAQAIAESIVPITQISDGQIQAPPATSSVVMFTTSDGPTITATQYPDTTVIVASTDSVVVPTIIASVSSGLVNATAPVSSGIYTNGTASITTTVAPASTTGAGSTPSPSTTTGPGSGASANMASFGGLAIAAVAMVFA